MTTLGAILLVGAALLLALDARAPAPGTGRLSRVMTPGLLAGLLAAIVTASLAGSGGDWNRPAAEPRTWNAFHYYLGARYFDELGYGGLYACALESDEHHRLWPEDTEAREMSTYAIVDRTELAPCPADRFTPARRQALGREVAHLLSRQTASWRANLVTDKGFNQTPVWTLAAGALAGRIPLSNDLGRRLLFSLDWISLCAAGVLVARAFGTQVAARVGIGIALYFGTFGLLLGNFMQYTWLACLLAAISLRKLDRIGWAATAMAASIGLGLFPALFLLPMAMRTAWLRPRRGTRAGAQAASGEAQMRRDARFVLASIVATGGLCALSAVILGADCWVDFARNMSLHTQHISGEAFSVGWKNLVATVGAGPFEAGFSYSEGALSTRNQLEALASLKIVYWVGVAAATPLFVLASRRCHSDESFALGWIAVYALLALSPYYSIALVLFLLPRPDTSPRVRITQIALLLLFAYHLWRPLVPYVRFDHARQLESEISIFGFLLLALAVFALPRGNRELDGGPETLETIRPESARH